MKRTRVQNRSQIASNSEKKEERGLAGSVRGRKATSADAAGSAIGSDGLFVFAAVCWKFLPDYSTPIVLASATLAWLAVAVLMWQVRKTNIEIGLRLWFLWLAVIITE